MYLFQFLYNTVFNICLFIYNINYMLTQSIQLTQLIESIQPTQPTQPTQSTQPTQPTQPTQQQYCWYWHNVLGKHCGFKKTRNFVKKYGINHEDSDGNTLLHLIDDYGVISWLLKNGANPNIKNNLGYVALQPYRNHYYDSDVLKKSLIPNAFRNEMYIKLLLDNGADPNLVNCPLHISLYNIPVIKLLVEYGLNTNSQNEDGSTFLIKLCILYRYHGRWINCIELIDIIELLLQNGVDIDICNNDGYNARQYVHDNIKHLFEKNYCGASL